MVRGQKRPAHVSFPERLKKARSAAGLTGTRLSLDAGLSDNAVANLERGRVPGIDTIERLAARLGVSPCWLAFGVEQPADAAESLRCATIGQRLASARTAAGLSGRGLASASETSSPTVLRIEKGAFIPRLDTVEKLATALRIAPCWLAFGLGPIEAPKRGRKPRARDAADEAALPGER